jgi:hypothetical protein
VRRDVAMKLLSDSMGLAFHHHILTCQVWARGCILDVGIDGIFNEIEEGVEAGVTIAFGGLFGSASKFGQKGKDFIRGDGFQLPGTKCIVKAGEKDLIILHRIFF